MVFHQSKSLLVVLALLFFGVFPGGLSFRSSFSLPWRQQHAFRESSAMKTTPRSFKLKSQSPEDVKINSQIARLNAVAAKLRAEAADLEAEQRKAMVDNLAVAFGVFDDHSGGLNTLTELKTGLSEVLAELINEDQAVRILKTFDTATEGATPTITSTEHYSAEAFRNKLYRILQDEKDAAFFAKREASTAKLAAEKAEAIAELVNNRAPTRLDRVLGGLPYLLPLLDAFPYGKFLADLMDLPDNPLYAGLARLHAAYRNVPLSGLVGFFSLNVLASGLRLNRLVRFNLQQAFLLDMALTVPAVLKFAVPAAAALLGAELPEELAPVSSSLVFVSLVGVFLYGVGSALMGREAGGIPFVSRYVTRRVPTHKEFLSMFDEEGNFRPPPVVVSGEILSSAYRTTQGGVTQSAAGQSGEGEVVSDAEKEERILKKEKLVDN